MRVGRALSETKYADEVEIILLKMIQDSNLDDFNRLICYYIFKNYIVHLEDKERQSINIEKLQVAERTLPAYLLSAIKNDD
jgi:hypothetical protein